jgi:hypothetical protein
VTCFKAVEIFRSHISVSVQRVYEDVVYGSRDLTCSWIGFLSNRGESRKKDSSRRLDIGFSRKQFEIRLKPRRVS